MFDSTTATDTNDTWLVKLHRLSLLCEGTVFDYNPWNLQPPIKIDDILTAISLGNLEPKSYGSRAENETWNRQQHIARIAFLVVNKDPSPIDIDVGVPELGFAAGWPVDDGNHRWAAAIVRKDPSILCSLSGSVKALRPLRAVSATDRTVKFGVKPKT